MTDLAARRSRDRPPTHPGSVLREDVLPALGLSIADAAARLGVSRQMLHRVVSERAALTPEMALRVGKLCGNGGRIWLAMQQAHDLWHAERAMAETLAGIATLRVA